MYLEIFRDLKFSCKTVREEQKETEGVGEWRLGPWSIDLLWTLKLRCLITVSLVRTTGSKNPRNNKETIKIQEQTI